MKTLYVCGDSFCCNDPEYPGSWIEKFQAIHGNLKIISLAVPGASNFQIYLQVKEALAKRCDYLIYHATSSIRFEFVADRLIKPQHGCFNYWNRALPEQQTQMLCTSWLTPDDSLFFDTDQAKSIKIFFKDFINIDVEIEKNYLFICATLNLISSSSVENWSWSRGGFDHKSFDNSKIWTFDCLDRECDYNLWDYYGRPSPTRPFYHISDPLVINTVCEHYSRMLNLSTHDTN